MRFNIITTDRWKEEYNKINGLKMEQGVIFENTPNERLFVIRYVDVSSIEELLEIKKVVNEELIFTNSLQDYKLNLCCPDVPVIEIYNGYRE